MGEIILGLSTSFCGGARRTEICGISSIMVLRRLLRAGPDALNVVVGSMVNGLSGCAAIKWYLVGRCMYRCCVFRYVLNDCVLRPAVEIERSN